MIYLINIQNPRSRNPIYTLFETHTESVMDVLGGHIKMLSNKYGITLKNIYIDNGDIHIKPWPHVIEYNLDSRRSGSNYVLLTKLSADRFKLVSHTGDVVYMSEFALKVNIEASNVINCKYTLNKKVDEKSDINVAIRKPEYKSTDTYNVRDDVEFGDQIASKYEAFIAKSLMVGLDMRFEYIIENGEVKIIYYSGESKKVILPNFVSTICSGAFKFKGIEEVKLTTNLKYIGKKAFAGNEIQSITIPESVQILYKSAFESRGSRLYTDKHDFNTANVKILNSKIKLL